MHTWHSSFAKPLKRIAQPRAYMMTPGKESSAPETNVLQSLLAPALDDSASASFGSAVAALIQQHLQHDPTLVAKYALDPH